MCRFPHFLIGSTLAEMWMLGTLLTQYRSVKEIILEKFGFFLIRLYVLKTTTIHFFIIKSMIAKTNEAGSSVLLLFRAFCLRALFFLLVLLRLNLLGLKLLHTQFIQTLWNLFVRSSRKWNPKINWFNSQSRKVKTKPRTTKPQHTQLSLPLKFRETACQSYLQRLFF